MSTSITIRKSRFEVTLNYQGGMPDALSATDLTLSIPPPLELGLDLTCNVKARNKSTNPYADANAYARGKHAVLASIQISEEQVCNALRRALEQHPGAEWQLTVHLDGQDHRYRATLCDMPYGVVLRVPVALRVVPG